MPYFKTFIHVLLTSLLIAACGGGITKKSDTAQGLYEYAVELQKDERFEEALRAYGEVKNKHPYSRYANDAELAMADIHFHRESYIEAQASYEVFKSLHPNHKDNDKVTYRIGMSYFHQLPSTIDRDLQLGQKAIFYFNQVINSYPNSDYVLDSKDKRIAVRKMLAEKELYIAKFYLKKEHYTSAFGRFENLLKVYPEAEFEGEALYGATYTSYLGGKNDAGKKYYDLLMSRFPESTFAKKARKELKKYVNP